MHRYFIVSSILDCNNKFFECNDRVEWAPIIYRVPVRKSRLVYRLFSKGICMTFGTHSNLW